MVDPRAKGARTETVARDMLRIHTALQWERVPGSGALDEKHGLKGDLYVPNEKNRYAVEVKGYAEDHVNTGLLTSKTPQLVEWWQQAVRQGQQVNREPLLIFKHDRSKLFVAHYDPNYSPDGSYSYMLINSKGYEFVVCLLEDWLTHEQPKFIA